MPANDIFVPGINFFGFSRYTSSTSDVHTTPESAFALLYAKPSTVPEGRSTMPNRFGPTPLEPPLVAVWHWAARPLNSFSPRSTSPGGRGARAFGGMMSTVYVCVGRF
ncbi:cytochrome c, putative [Leishmania tarentolae]|nr:cytochrome c, putative [Leishmania tarentolae]